MPIGNRLGFKRASPRMLAGSSRCPGSTDNSRHPISGSAPPRCRRHLGAEAIYGLTVVREGDAEYPTAARYLAFARQAAGGKHIKEGCHSAFAPGNDFC